MFGRAVLNSIRSSSFAHSGTVMGAKLQDYFQIPNRSGNSTLFPQGAHAIKISNIAKLGGGLSNDVYSFYLSYEVGTSKRTQVAILKTYLKTIDPFEVIRKHYAYSGEGLSRCNREFQMLRNLKFVGFPVPEVYDCETNVRFLGLPFIITQKEEVVKKSIEEVVDSFAQTLANLHNLQLSRINVNFLRTPEDEYAFARSWPIHFKKYLNNEPKHEKKLKKEFNLAIRWLHSNVTKNECPQYCLIHGDYHPGNVCVNQDSELIVLDWDSIEIGDPALDVGYAYHFIKFFSNPWNPNLAEPVADRFVSEYAKHFKGDVGRRLNYYKLVGILGASIFYSSGLSNPIYAYRNHHRKIIPSLPFFGSFIVLLGFPFIKHPLIARQLATEGDLLWLKYFENSLGTLTNS